MNCNTTHYRANSSSVPGDPTLTDGQLLEGFVGRRDAAAMEVLVRRHAPMVWGVCRRLLRNHHDAEDAFQATLLVFVRKAASVWPREAVGNWLYGVARTTALKARATGAKRQAREKQVVEMPEPEALPDPGLCRDLRPLLDQELSRLPDKYRTAVVLCDLEGRPRREVAGQLNVPEGTLSSRLTTARTMLAKRLARRGVALSAGALAALLSQGAVSAAVPTSVLSPTIKAARLSAAGHGATLAASAPVAALTQGVLKTMLVTKLKTAALVLLAVSLFGLGMTAFAYRTLASDPGGATDDAAKAVAEDREKGDGGAERGKQAGELAAKPVPAADANDPFAGKPQAGGETKPGKEGPVDGQAGDNAKLRGLLQERLEAVQTLADKVKRLHQQGSASQGDVRQADLRVYRAELDLCETTKERIAVLEKIAKVYEEMEDHTAALAKQGAASSESLIEAKVSRLEAQIAVERERAKLSTPPK